jgi:hypothetical protein
MLGPDILAERTLATSITGIGCVIEQEIVMNGGALNLVKGKSGSRN